MDLDREIIKVQRSTRTLFRVFTPVHNWLRQQSRLYYIWSLKPYSHAVHWTVLLFAVLILPFWVMNNFSTKPVTTKASDFPKWEWVNPKPTHNTLNGIDMISSSNVWMAGAHGTILHCDSSSCASSFSNTDGDLNDISAADTNNIWAVGAGGIILKTENGGSSWTEQVSNTENQLSAVKAVDANTAWAVGASGTIIKTTDGGAVWTQQSSGVSTTINDIDAFDANTAWAAGESGFVKKSTDGETWQFPAVRPATIYNYKSVDMVDNDANVIWTITEQKVYRTNNSGASWGSKNFTGSPNFLSVVVSSYESGWIAGASKVYMTLNFSSNTWLEQTGKVGKSIAMSDIDNLWLIGAPIDETTTVPLIYKTESGSTNPPTWVSMVSDITNGGDDDDFYDASFADDNNGWIVGWGGGPTKMMIYNSTNGGGSWQNQSDNIQLENKAGLLYSVSSVLQSDTTKVWAVGAAGLLADNLMSIILKTTDNGSTWTREGPEDLGMLYDVEAVDLNNVFAVGLSGIILRTTDGGIQWDNISANDPLPGVSLLSVSCVDEFRCWAVGENETILETANGGTSWKIKKNVSSSGISFNSVKAIKKNDGSVVVWVSGGNPSTSGEILKSIDGENFGSSVFEATNTVYLDATDQNNAWAVIQPFGAAPTSYVKTTNGGVSWSTPFNLFDSSPNNIRVQGSSSLWIMAARGDILHYTAPLGAIADRFLVKLPGQSFGNDGSGVTGIPTALKAGQGVKACVYAVDGNLLLDTSSAYHVAFDTSDPNDVNPAQISLNQGQDNDCKVDGITTSYGVGSADFVFHTPGQWIITATDAGNSGLSPINSSNLVILPGDPHQLVFTNKPASLDIGTAASSMTVKAQDQYGNDTTVAFDTAIHLSTTSPTGKFSTDNGIWTNSSIDLVIPAGSGSISFNYIDFTTGPSSLVASESPDTGFIDASGTITITENPSPPSAGSQTVGSISLYAPSHSLAAGTAISLTLNLLDQNKNLAYSSKDRVNFSSSDSNAVLPSEYLFTASDSGSHTFTGLILKTIDNQTISAIDIDTGAVGQISILISNASSSPSLSTVYSDKKNLILGKNTSTIKIKIFDDYSNPVQGKNVILNFDPSYGDLDKAQSTTSEAGIASFIFTPKKEGAVEISAYDMTDKFTLDQKLVLTLRNDTLANNVAGAIQNLVNSLQNSETAKALAKLVAPLVTAAAGIGLLPIIANVIGAVPQAVHLVTYGFSLGLEAIGIKRRRKSWGKVYNSSSGKPLDMALVRLYDAETMRLVSTIVSDPRGRYNFQPAPGKYVLSVSHPGYVFPTSLFAKYGIKNLEKINSIQFRHYVGQPVTISGENNLLNIEIPMDPVRKKGGFFIRVKVFASDLFDAITLGLPYIFVPTLVFGFVLAAFTAIVMPGMRNLLIFALYDIISLTYFVSRIVKASHNGVVYNSRTKKPISDAVVSIFDKVYDTLLETRITDRYGRFQFFVKKGKYYLKAEKEGFTFPSKMIDKSQSRDHLYKNLYSGAVLDFKKESFVKVSIAMDGGDAIDLKISKLSGLSTIYWT